MIGQKNVSHIVIGKDLDLLASGTRASLASGQVGVFANGSQTPKTDALAAGDIFTIAYKNADGEVVNTPHIEYSNILRKSSTAYAAATQKKVYVGYNGTTGSINVENSDSYILSVILKDTTTAFATHPPYEYAEYQSDADATEKEIAEGIIASAILNMTAIYKTNKKVMVQPGLIASAAVTTANALDNNTTVVQGSNTITVATNLQYNAGGGTLAVGDFVRIGTVGGGTALTSEVYKVTAINSLVVTLDRPVVEASGTYATATDDVEVITAATAANVATNWGISLTGVAQEFKAGLLKYQVVDFEAVLNSSAFDNTLITTATARTKGTGTYEEIAEIESFLKGNRGETFRVASYPVTKTLDATSGKTYDVIVFDYKDTSVTGIDRQIEHYGTVIIATEDESGATLNTDLKTVLGIS